MKKEIYIFSIFLVAVLFSNLAMAQVSRSAYFMDHLFAANSLNPAFTPSNNVIVDLPLISSTYVSLGAPFTWSEFTHKTVSDDKLTVNKYGVISSMDEVGTLSLNFATQLGRVGIRSGKHFFSFGLSKIAVVDISLEKDLAEFLLYGNGSDAFIGRDLHFSKTGFKANMYHQYSFGYAVDISEKLSIGVKAKYLNGVLNAWTEKADLNFYTDPESNYALSASTDILLHTASAYGYLEDVNFDNPMDYLMVKFTSNHGFAGDIGASYRPMEKLKLSASVIDLGMINWNTNVKSYQSRHPNETFTFDGFDISELLNGGSIADSITILDSLNEHFAMESISEPYTSYLTPRAYLGVTYDVTKNDQFGLLISGRFPENDIQTAYTLNYRRTFGDILSAFVNYTYRKNGNQVGFGLSVCTGPVVIYVMNDMFNALLEPTQAKGYNVHFGISLAFGKPNRDELPDDGDVPDQESEKMNTP